MRVLCTRDPCEAAYVVVQDKRKDAVKKVIAALTVGKDVSSLFTDVVNCMQTENLELKTLVYLYLINYAKSQPDLAILAVNTFAKDSRDPNPLIRALAVRTMGCIRVDKIIEYLCDPLLRCLKDDDPYVRKTGAICVAKLFDINAELVEDRGFLESLKDSISDNNPMVVANAVAALAEIQENSSRPLFEITGHTLSKLLTALNECTEWGQVFILDALSRYKAADARETENIVASYSTTTCLLHANCAVVLSAVKVFFCKYNDAIYVKMEKLEIMIKLASDRNIDQVLLEFKEYATEVDVDFVRRAVRVIGRCAIKLERAAERCISVLLELIKIKVNYVVQEAIIVIKDIFRRYPNTCESIIATLCESLDTLDEPEAKAAKDVVLAEKPVISDDSNQLDPSVLDGLLANIATLSSVYHKPPEPFVTRTKTTAQKTEDDDYPDGSETGLDNSAIIPVDQTSTPGPPLPVLLPASAGHGLQIGEPLTRRDGQIFYSLLFENNSQIPLDGFMIQFNKNIFGLAAAGPLQVPQLQPGTSAATLLPMVLFENMSAGPPNSLLQVAMKIINSQYCTSIAKFHCVYSLLRMGGWNVGAS
ncbi:hypothetical protein GH714_035699 [Hevea brasiliensis]|uniref:Clathrin adaptor alpha/beta/gamma-adaptin appendage Ig-like subdomain domain-containing protein n=1 Tax=Hevea brasiliensis TaxID=3981 RepID=A0A6A6KS79_HEVBR|nr:hypothetical protein GH714_035699 [Hevea brasiliensis]